MSRHTIRSLIGATALFLVAGAAVAPVAQADQTRPTSSATTASSTDWKLSYRFSVGSIDFTMRGRVQDAAGNAHSGQIWFDTSDDEDEAILNDWSCVHGVYPPAYYDSTNPPAKCLLLRSVYFSSGHALPYTDWLMTNAHEVGKHAASDNLTGAHAGPPQWSNYTLTGVGPVLTTTTIGGDPTSKVVGKTRVAVPTGHFAWIKFNDKRLHVLSAQIYGEWDYDQA